MERTILSKLVEWKKSNSRKPLILKGARQVGKTYILKYFGEHFYDNYVYFNFDHDEGLSNLFQNTKNPRRIIEQLILVSESKIRPETTLIIFDEIQECPECLNSLKYFCEEASEYHIACAGSLLGIRLSHTSFPVGKVDFLNLYPMSFDEFLVAEGSKNLVEYMNSIHEVQELEKVFTNILEEKLKTYFIVGGMPEVVTSWVTERDMEKVNYLQDAILVSYEQDFSKHTTNSEANKISLIWNGIPSQLARDNKKFVYQVIKEGARAREYEGALEWLFSADLITKIYNVKAPRFPLRAYRDLNSFKIYMGDIGLLRRMARLSGSILLNGNQLFSEFKGAMTENYCLNTLKLICEDIPNYYVFDRYEIDFVIQHENIVIPIEVKSGGNQSHISLTKYNDKEKNELCLRFSLDNLKKDGTILNVPLYFVGHLFQLLENKKS